MANPQGGAFLTSRELFGNPIWKNIVEFRLFFLIYGNAVFSEVKIADDLILQRGQWLRSTRKLQDDLEYIENRQVKTYSVSTINRTIQRLVRLQRVCTKTHELGTVFTVLNYEQYQGFGHYTKPELGTQLGTVTEQPRNNNKNVKNDINLKDIIYSPFNEDLIGKEEEEVKKPIEEIFTFWKSKNLVQHRLLNPRIKMQISWKLDSYSPEELKEVISNYAEIYHSPDYVLDTKWGLDDFLEKGHFEKFLTERDPYSFYPKTRKALAEINPPPASKQTKLQKNKDLLLGKGGKAHDGRGDQVPPVQSFGSLPEPT
ncbi:hypothetical protein PAECIP111891_04230 [Paenibacillus allorhizoplanae]|uniref:Uncharacterized protein n=1 Tax=Paenibacillus allorhizoplanae TaxID=2905648 RepID=A0ABN8GQ34_9BACL|nr:hypothetical protein [Paenibacillus allorhizoplanae]CAH1215210.1 hypothetical protein PAECIP111891_04230 [Paenibacillus allorhizoplanae]